MSRQWRPKGLMVVTCVGVRSSMLVKSSYDGPQRVNGRPNDKERKCQPLQSEERRIAEQDDRTPLEERAFELGDVEDRGARPPPAQLARDLLPSNIRRAARERDPACLYRG